MGLGGGASGQDGIGLRWDLGADLSWNWDGIWIETGYGLGLGLELGFWLEMGLGLGWDYGFFPLNQRSTVQSVLDAFPGLSPGKSI